MFGKVISSPGTEDRSALLQKNRQHARRSDDRCVSIINGQMHPVENWSKGGMLISADDRLFGIDQECTFTLKFKLRDEIMEIDHKAKVIRKAPSKVALRFLPLNKSVQARFQQVVDDYVAQRFVDSQTV
ncbi:MAG: PilZ domain-containing protein [Alcanivorax sp.]